MPPTVILAMISAALSFLKEAIPQVREMANRGDVSPEDQKRVLDEYKSLRERAEGQFSGPEWDRSGRS